MANSIGSPAGQRGGKFQHALSRSRIEIQSDRMRMRHRLERDGLVANFPIDYFIGSGNKGRSYMFAIGGRLFQSPAAFYSDKRTWDLSPGFDLERDLDFDRPITSECLFCHAGKPRPVPFTLNSYESPPFETASISCERCHGSPDMHIRQPSARNIINPSKLEAPLRDAVCDQCHVGGEARILNPGRQLQDYHPGKPLEDVLTVYVFDNQSGNSREPLKVVSHSEQLAASKCAQQSGGRMWCGSCHDPHDKPLNPAVYYSERCGQCHGPSSLTKHVQPVGDCIPCHMPRRSTYDGGHTAFTDHQILAEPQVGQRAQSLPLKLRPWREPANAISKRNLGLAHISVGERHQSPEHLNEGFRQLSSVQQEFVNDTAVLTSLGAVLQRKGAHGAAARLFSRASELEPRDARHRLNLAIALVGAGQTEQAIGELNAAIALDPSIRDSYVMLAEIYGGMNQPEKQRETLRRYLVLMPQSLVVRKMLRRN
jgi:Tetratricopeptide repeat